MKNLFYWVAPADPVADPVASVAAGSDAPEDEGVDAPVAPLLPVARSNEALGDASRGGADGADWIVTDGAEGVQAGEAEVDEEPLGAPIADVPALVDGGGLAGATRTVACGTG